LLIHNHRVLLIMAGLLSAFAPLAHALTAQQILSKADAIRMPKGDKRVVVLLSSSRGGVEQQSAEYETLLSGNEKTLIKTLAPLSDKGTSFLMLKRDLWVFLPDAAQPVRVSLQQRLMGEVSNGDLARANFVGDYTAKLVQLGKDHYELMLTAVSEDVTYSAVRYWVQKKTFRPMKAAFYADTGRLLKVLDYQEYKLIEGVMRPSRLVFQDAIEKTKQSTLIYKSIESTTFADKLFTKDYLKKLKY
jgi:hypothetical protein